MKVDPKLIKRVEINETIDIGVAKVTFLDANHCPGAAILLFEVPSPAPSSSPSATSSSSSKFYLHTGDMRYHPRFKLYPALQNMHGRIDKIFLDTTYARKNHDFASQEASIASVVGLSEAFLREHPDGLILCGSYNIGKERIVCSLQDKLSLKVCMDEDKLKMMSCLEDELDIGRRIREGLFTSDPSEARVHICRMGFAGSMMPFFKPNFENVEGLRHQLNGTGTGTGTENSVNTNTDSSSKKQKKKSDNSSSNYSNNSSNSNSNNSSGNNSSNSSNNLQKRQYHS